MSDARNVRCVPILYRPNNRIVLGLECRHYMIRVILNDIIRNWAALSLAFWTGLHDTTAILTLPFLPPLAGFVVFRMARCAPALGRLSTAVTPHYPTMQDA